MAFFDSGWNSRRCLKMASFAFPGHIWTFHTWAFWAWFRKWISKNCTSSYFSRNRQTGNMKNERLKHIFCLNSNPPGPLVPMANVQSNPDAIQLHLSGFGANRRYLVVPSNPRANLLRLREKTTQKKKRSSTCDKFWAEKGIRNRQDIPYFKSPFSPKIPATTERKKIYPGEN